MAHWGWLIESRLEATQPDRSNEGKHLAPACLIVDGTDNFLCTEPQPRDHEVADEHDSRGCKALCRISCEQGAVGLAGGLRESRNVRAQSVRELSWFHSFSAMFWLFGRAAGCRTASELH